MLSGVLSVILLALVLCAFGFGVYSIVKGRKNKGCSCCKGCNAAGVCNYEDGD